MKLKAPTSFQKKGGSRSSVKLAKVVVSQDHRLHWIRTPYAFPSLLCVSFRRSETYRPVPRSVKLRVGGDVADIAGVEEVTRMDVLLVLLEESKGR